MSDIVLGVDPGSRTTGYAVLQKNGHRFETAGYGVISLLHLEEHSDRLRELYSSINKLLDRYQPSSCAVETPVYGKDPLAMLKLGRAQAAILLAVINHGISITEYYPKTVKKSITGRGNASKEQVAYMLRRMIKMPDENIPADASDALAVAWCHYLQKASPAEMLQGNRKKHQNRKSSSWTEFVKENPDRISNI